MEGLYDVRDITEPGLKLLKFTWSGSKVYLFWIMVHFMISNSYSYICTPKSGYGLLTSPIRVSSPHCKGLRWAFETSGQAVDNMWLVLATWITNKMIGFI